MTPRPRFRAVLATLGAALLMTLAVPTADAWVPQARAYRASGPITLDTNLLSASGASAWAIDEYLAANTSLPPLGKAFMAAERKYGVNARFLLAAAMHESGWGSSDIARLKHNLFGYNAYDRDPFRYASAYATYAANIDATAKFIKDFYLTAGGRWWGGQPTLRSMQQYWSSSHRWGASVSGVASSIRFDAFAGKSVRMAAPVVRGQLHGGDRASVKVAWTGPALPAGVTFLATWTPIALDADVIANAASPAADTSDTVSPAPAPTGSAPGDAPLAAIAPASGAPASGTGLPAPAGSPGISSPPLSSDQPAISSATVRTASSPHATTLSVAAPQAAGRYQLSLDLRDSDGSVLPKGERVSVPGVEVRVWGDQALTVSLAASPDGSGVAVRLTNTGRLPIPARAEADPASQGDLESRAVSMLTVTATSADPENPTPALLLAAPLGADLAPGASVTFAVPRIVAATGRDGNWLSVELGLPGDPAWVAAYAPVVAWFADGKLGTSPADSSAPAADALVGPLQPTAGSPTALAPTAPTTPVPTPKPTPMPVPSAAPIPTPTTPAPGATPSPVRHGTSYLSERSSAIAYSGRWASAGSAAYSGGSVLWSTTPGATATLTFTGDSVTWIGPMGPTRGLAQILIDGKAVTTVSLWRSGFVPQVALYAKRFPSVGRHTLTIKVLSSPGHPYVAIDEFVVRY